MPLLEVRSAGKEFGGFVAVQGADLTVDAGEVVGLLGANGAGKTTLIRMILGLLRPTNGNVELFGAPVTRAARARIGYVPQGLGLYTDLTVEENLEFVARAYGTPPPDAMALAEPRATVGTLSLGIQRRTAFAAAFSHSPDLLVLDEPTSGVSALARARLWDGIRAAADGGAGVLVTTHHMAEAEGCDRVVVMNSGRIVAEGTLEAILGDSKSVRVDSTDWPAAFDALDRAGFMTSLVGTVVTVPEADPGEVEDVLRAAGVRASISLVPASFDEHFVALARR
jgi:ABC-2 type transport system ATP-binding protein/ribosome-dependent ATPase